jgi:hypothetical protein
MPVGSEYPNGLSLLNEYPVFVIPFKGSSDMNCPVPGS